MSLCANPGCSRNDDVSDDEMMLEYMPHDDVWVPVCTKHAADTNHPTVRLTDAVKQMDVSVLSQIKDDLLDE